MTVLSPLAIVRDIAVSAGASELVWGQITELNGQDISIDTYTVALVPKGEVPPVAEFRTPSAGASGDTPDVYRVALLVDASTVLTRGAHTLWARVVDTAEIVIFPVSGTIELS